MLIKFLLRALPICLLLSGAAYASHTPSQDKDPAVMQVDVTVGKNGAAFLNQLHETAAQSGFAMRVTPIELPKKRHKKPKHKPKAPPPPEPPTYTPMLIEIWRNDIKIVADNAKSEETYHFDFYNWILTPRYVIDKTIKPYRNVHGTPCEEFLRTLQTAASLVPGVAVSVTQPETQGVQEQSDSVAEPLRRLQVTVSADHYRRFVRDLETFALENGYAVYADASAPGVHDRFYSDELFVAVTSNASGDIDIALYEGDAGNTTRAFNAFLEGLQSVLDEIPYALVHEQKPYDWPMPGKESY